MPDLPTICPSCRASLATTRLRCVDCGTAVEGEFSIPTLLRLSASDLEFVLRFVKASGSLKDVAAQYGQSYPTIRNRLDQIIAGISDTDQRREDSRRGILDAIANGTLSVAAAERKLREAE